MNKYNERYILRCNRKLSVEEYKTLEELLTLELDSDAAVVVLPHDVELLHVSDVVGPDLRSIEDETVSFHNAASRKSDS